MEFVLLAIIAVMGSALYANHIRYRETQNELTKLTDRVETGKAVASIAADLSIKTGMGYEEAVKAVQMAMDTTPRRSRSREAKFRR